MSSHSTLQDWLTWSFSPTISAILVTLFVSLSLPVLIHLYLYRKAVAREIPSFLLIGPSGSGKTSLLALMSNSPLLDTHTSQIPLTATCHLPSSIRSTDDRYRSENDTSPRPKFNLIDTPGHGKLRHHAISSLTSPATLKGIVFVVDSAAVSSPSGLTETAEYLHDILLLLQKRHATNRSSKGPVAIPVLLAANKQDVFTSLPAGLVKTKLEAEIGKVRQTRSRRLMDSGVGMEDGVGGEEDEEGSWLGEYGSKSFSFAQMQESEIEVCVEGGNVRGEGEEAGKVEEWWAWIGENL